MTKRAESFLTGTLTGDRSRGFLLTGREERTLWKLQRLARYAAKSLPIKSMREPSVNTVAQTVRDLPTQSKRTDGTPSQDYYSDGSNKTPRYYQLLAINKTVEAIARGQSRILLVMATGTGKTFTAFQIIWRLWKSKAKRRILFLADRNILVDQTMTNDFKPFGSAMTKIKKRQADKSYEIYLSLYQAVSGSQEEKNIYKQFSKDFFDLIMALSQQMVDF